MVCRGKRSFAVAKDEAGALRGNVDDLCTGCRQDRFGEQRGHLGRRAAGVGGPAGSVAQIEKKRFVRFKVCGQILECLAFLLTRNDDIARLKRFGSLRCFAAAKLRVDFRTGQPCGLFDKPGVNSLCIQAIAKQKPWLRHCVRVLSPGSSETDSLVICQTIPNPITRALKGARQVRLLRGLKFMSLTTAFYVTSKQSRIEPADGEVGGS